MVWLQEMGFLVLLLAFPQQAHTDTCSTLRQPSHTESDALKYLKVQFQELFFYFFSKSKA